MKPKNMSNYMTCEEIMIKEPWKVIEEKGLFEKTNFDFD
jgi:hypothetical protein